MSQGDEVEQHETGSFERTEACECYPPEFHRECIRIVKARLHDRRGDGCSHRLSESGSDMS